MRNFIKAGAWVPVLIAVAVPSYGQTLEEVEKKIIEAHAKLKSYTAKLTMNQSMDQAGMSSKMEAEGDMKWMRKDDKTLMRLDMKTKTTMSMGGQDMNQEGAMTMIMDGEHVYTIVEQMGQKMAVKNDVQPEMSGDPQKMFEALHEEHDVKLLPEEKMGDQECYVIEVTPKKQETDPDAPPVAKQRHYFSKKTGMGLKNVGYGEGDKVIMTVEVKGVETDVTIDPKLFIFEKTEGMMVQDMTQPKTEG